MHGSGRFPAGHQTVAARPPAASRWLLHRPVFTALARIGVVFLLIGLVSESLEGDWSGAALFALFAVGSVALLLLPTRLPPLFDLLFVTAAILSAVGWSWDMAERIPLYDQVNHFFTIFALTLAVGYRVYDGVRDSFRRHPPLFLIAIASFGISIGAIWEIFEWAIGALGPSRDIIFDLSADSIGAVAAAALAAWAIRFTDGATREER